MNKILGRLTLLMALSIVLESCNAGPGVNIDGLNLISVGRPDPKIIDKSEGDVSNDIVITLMDVRDIRSIAEKNEFNIGVEAYFCPAGKIDVSNPDFSQSLGASGLRI